MKSRVVTIFLFVILFFFAACSRNEGGEIIPRKVFSKIYAEMFITDQWIREHTELAVVADTTLVYEPIFNKYGYTTDDYLKSVDYYIYDPVRFNKILQESAEIIHKKIREFEVNNDEE